MKFGNLLSAGLIAVVAFAMTSKADAASVEYFVTGKLTFFGVQNQGTVTDDTIDALRGIIEQDLSFSAILNVDESVADTDPGPNAFYPEATDETPFSVGGFDFLDSNIRCIDGQIDCAVRVFDNEFADGNGGFFDRLDVSSAILESLALGTQLSDETGIIPSFDIGSQSFPAPKEISATFRLRSGGVDLLQSDAIPDFAAVPEYAGSVLFFLRDGLWGTSDELGLTPRTARITYALSDIKVTDTPQVVPVPASAVLLLGGLFALGVTRRFAGRRG